ncbi:MAG: hypothetical protein ACTHN5_20330 [Phycisphaerae bacterium]
MTSRPPQLLKAAALSALLPLAGCQSTKLLNISAPTPEMQRVQAAMAAWPHAPADAPAIKRPFFTTIHIAGRRTTASGLLQFHSPRDFRITAATEMGVILFDGRMNWAGVSVLRSMPGIDPGIIASLLTDLTTAFQLPDSLRGIEAKGATANGTPTALVLKKQGADTNHYTWTFDPRTGRLRTLDVDMSLFKTVHISYLRYDARGWPEEISVKAPLYSISFTFTDSGDVAKAK